MLSIKATFPNLNRNLLILGLGAFGAGAALLNLLDVFVVFLIYLSIIFIPVAGIIITDYLFVRRADYRIEQLDQNRKFAPIAFLRLVHRRQRFAADVLGRAAIAQSD